MAGICDGRVAVITGAGAGLGRGYALAFAAEGARVVVNDINREAGRAVVEEVRAAGGEALFNCDDITDHAAAGEIVRAALDAFGALHVVVNNAGVCRDRMFVSLSDREWDEVMRVHLRGHFCLSSQACAHWRAEHKRGQPVDNPRIVNTSSGAGLQGSVGQSNYAAAKAGIAALTLVQAVELARYGITANALAPSARTAMTLEVEAFAEQMKAPEEGFDYFNPENIAPLVVWLGSPASAHVTGRVFEAVGDQISVADGWRTGEWVKNGGARWQPRDVGAAVDDLLAKAEPPQPVYGAQ